MQNARDTFYVTLRDRLAALNPARTIVVRGLTRPGVLVIENELVAAGLPTNVFCLRWKETKVDEGSALPLVTMGCEIQYTTSGSDGGSGMDRGRLLAAMDAELCAAVREAPRSVGKMQYSTTPASSMLTKVFWGDATFAPVTADGERLLRTSAVEVFCYQEEGEL